MKVTLKCFATLANKGCCNYKSGTSFRLERGQTVDDLFDQAGIERDEVQIAFVNNRRVGFDTLLVDGDRVGLAPPVGGM